MTPRLRRALVWLASLALTLTLGGAAVAGELIVITTEIFYDSAWHDISADVRNAQPVRLTCGIRNEGGTAGAGALSLQLNNGLSTVNTDVVGRYSPRNAMSDLYGKIGRNTPIRVTAGLDGGTPSVRGVLEVVKWPATWGRAGRADSWVTVEAAGIFRRLGQSDPLRNTMRRFIEQHPDTVVGYWPLDDPVSSTEGRSVLGGSDALVNAGSTIEDSNGSVAAIYPIWNGVQLAPHLGTGVEMERFSTDVETDSPALFAVVDTTGDEEAWAVDLLFRGNPTGAFVSLQMGADAGDIPPFYRIGVEVTDVQPNVDVFTFDQDGFIDFWTSAIDGTPVFGNDQLHHFRFYATEAGGLLDWTAYLDGEQVGADTSATEALTPLEFLRVFAPGESPTGTKMIVGEVVAWAGDASAIPSIADTYAAATGYSGELAGRRAERICDEQSIAFTSTGDLDDTQPMGAQRPLNVLALLSECATIESVGALLPVLTEQRAALGLHFRTRASHYNQAAGLALDYSAGHVWEPFAPTPDDQHIANDVRVKDLAGHEESSVQETGPLNVQDPVDDPQGVHRYEKPVTVNSEDPGQLGLLASWRRHVGTWDEERYPELTIDVRGLSTRTGGEALVDDALALELGDRITIDNPPEWMPPETIDQLLLGRDESISISKWTL